MQGAFGTGTWGLVQAAAAAITISKIRGSIVMSSITSGAEASDRKQVIAGRRAVVAASVGNALEWYDFIIYALFAVYIAQNFFPGGDQTTELVKAFIAFGLGFIIRPLGAVLIGVYADRAGRKAALTLTIMIMALGTLVIAAAPTYAAIGIGAPLLLLVGRMLQGFSAGGELGGAAAFLVEHAPEGKKGKYASWLQGSMAISNILAALVAFTVTALLTQQQIGEWGWRLPFLVGLLIAPVGIWMRRTLDETPHFREEIARQNKSGVTERLPLKAAFVEFWRELLKGTGMCVLWGVSTYTLVIFMPIYIQRSFGMSGSDTFLASLIGNVFMLISCVVAGSLSDVVGRKKVLVVAAIILATAVHPLLWLLHMSSTLPTLIFVQTAFCIMVGLYVGVAPSALSEIFPTRVRSTGMSLAYNTAATIFGGFAPAILTWLSQGGGIYAPAWYMTAAAACALLAIATLKRPVG
ncbi:UNVERIFIED_ORG: MHS family proline/betaine transporter-like MFS transporter [Ensifer adhaerens]|nr:MHS family proline/betaine transporter-like MFS transporter [Ensifer adhaerens]